MEEEYSLSVDEQLRPGSQCLLLLMGQRFLVSVISVKPDAVRVTFPMSDFPVPGMHVEIELHDESGYTSYELEVLEAPTEVGGGLLLGRPTGMARNRHRSSLRVSADFPVYLKGHVHPRRYTAQVVNISAGGMLLRSEAALSVNDILDVSFALPGEREPQELVAEVVHLSGEASTNGERYLGIRFVSPEPASVRALRSYVWRRLRELHPHGLTFLRRVADQMGAPFLRRRTDVRA